MPDAKEYGERAFSNGLGRRAMFGNCADCAKTLDDYAKLVCDDCRQSPKNRLNPRFPVWEQGHRDRIREYAAKGKL